MAAELLGVVLSAGGVDAVVLGVVVGSTTAVVVGVVVGGSLVVGSSVVVPLFCLFKAICTSLVATTGSDEWTSSKALLS